MTVDPIYRIWENYTRVYNWNKNAKKPVIINQGGSYSSKTISIEQVLIDLAIENPGSVITVTGEDLPTLKRDALREFKSLIQSDRVSPFFQNPSLDAGPYKLHNGSIIEFVCFQTIQEAKGAKRDFLYVSEANGVKWDIFLQLWKRTTIRTFIDYNPSAEFWAHTELMHRDDCQVIISTFNDNKFCSEEKRKDLFNYYENYLKTGDEYWLNQWRVYGQGKTGIISGAVITNAKVIDKFPDPYYLKSNNEGLTNFYGLDFGYTTDPTAIVKIGFRSSDMRIVGQQKFYESGYNSLLLADLFPTLGIRKGIDVIIADSANMEAIDILAWKGYRMVAAKKDPGSVKAGIEVINKHGIDITYDSYDFIKERKNYVYRKTGGRHDKNLPGDNNNHLWDATRYAVNYILYGHGELRGKVIKKPKQRVAITA